MSRKLLKELHDDFIIVDRAAIEELVVELEYQTKWRERSLKLIKKLRRKLNGKKKNK